MRVRGHVSADPQRIDDYPLVCAELCALEAAECRRVRVLPLAVQLEVDPLDVKGQTGDFVVPEGGGDGSANISSKATTKAEDKLRLEPSRLLKKSASGER